MPADRREFLRHAALPAAAGLTPLTATGAPAGGLDMPPDAPRELKPTGADLGTLFEPVSELAKHGKYAYSFLGERFKTLDEFHAAGREKVFECFGYKPPKVDPKPEVIERVECDGYLREKLVFSTGPLFRVPAYVLIPKGLKKPAPAVVDLHSHGGMFIFGKEKVIDFGKNHPVMTDYHQKNYDGRPTATQLVRRGYVVIVIDAFMFGERRAMLDADLKSGWDRTKYTADDVSRLNQKCRAKESTIAKGLAFAGLTWPGVVTWDDIRTVDYLISRPEVDPKRIGCLGISMGGHRTLYLAGLDDRIKAACVTGFMSTIRPMIKAHLDTHSFVHFVPGLHRYLDMPDVVSLATPRALMVQQCEKDGLFPLTGMKEALDVIAKVYEKAGAKEQFVGRFYNEPHKFTKAMQDDAFAFLDKHLK